MKNNFKKIISILMLVMVFMFTMCGCSTQKLDNPGAESAGADDWMDETEAAETMAQTESETVSASEEDYFDVESVEDESEDYSKYEEKTVGNVTYSDGDATNQDEYNTDPIPEGKQNPVEPGSVEIDTSKEMTCYLSISCGTILDNMDDLTPGKEDLVPSDGVIYAQREVTFYPGESVFDVLQRETRNNRIHMEFNTVPKYNSAYIEGINNLYEFDCGENSGWMYCVNGWYPNYGVSRYVVQQGDVIELNYTCDLGRDLGQSWVD